MSCGYRSRAEHFGHYAKMADFESSGRHGELLKSRHTLSGPATIICPSLKGPSISTAHPVAQRRLHHPWMTLSELSPALVWFTETRGATGYRTFYWPSSLFAEGGRIKAEREMLEKERSTRAGGRSGRGLEMIHTEAIGRDWLEQLSMWEPRMFRLLLWNPGKNCAICCW